MDKNTIIGLVLIGIILSVFTIYNQPTKEEIEAEKAKIELAEKQRIEAEKKAKEKDKDPKDETGIEKETNNSLIPKLDDLNEQIKTENGDLVFTDTITKRDTIVPYSNNLNKESLSTDKKDINGELIRLENEKFIIDFNTRGGQISSVLLKEFETYDNFAKNDGKLEPLAFFKKGDATNGIELPMQSGILNTEQELFTVKTKTDSKIVFELKKQGNQSIEFVYQLKPDAYDLDHYINIKGFSGKVRPQEVMFNWNAALRRTERLFSEQRRVSTVCYKQSEEGFTWLSEMGSSEAEAEDDLDWINFKQSYFSSFIRAENGFAKEGSKVSIQSYEEGDERMWRNLKDYSSRMNLNLSDVDNASVKINWFFGPNDYKVLTSYNEGYDDVLNYGWGLFRWINLYAVQPMFNVLKDSGINIGIAILLLTLIIKFALMPIQWKMYASSAKMRILKPEIERIGEKYPDKEDAMKKQMETMTLYRESGASPLSGCVPMLIQMPILLAVFRFFPSTFDLRQKSFLWAEDLSSYDSVYDFGFNIWPYGDHISLFTLLMAGTTLIYTVINSSNMQAPQQKGMPNMKVMMYFMPIIMIFFFNNYSSGLSYYYFLSTLASILIMIMIKKFFVDEEKLKLKMAQRKAAAEASPKKAKTKSKFQQRLEQMQKAQQEQMKNRKKK